MQNHIYSNLLDKPQILPRNGERATTYADRLAVVYASKVSDSHKKALGQFFTPQPVANFLADFGKCASTRIKILDPGCGIGILSAALCEKLADKHSDLRVIELVAFESDIDLLSYAEQCFDYLGKWLKQREIEFTYFLCKNDFILHNSPILSSDAAIAGEYDIIISNPPYFKLSKGDLRAEAAKKVSYGQTNIYSIFMIISAKLLKQHGQLIFITPRSFCSGSYFRLFRELFFSLINLNIIHLFNTRNNAFKRDKVLQENIIVVASRKTALLAEKVNTSFDLEAEQVVEVSSSQGIQDIDQRVVKSYPLSNLLNMSSYQKMLYLPMNETDEEILGQFRQWRGSLQQYDLGISTGPIVDFRSVEFIRFESAENTVPLLWLHNVKSMNVKWPQAQERGKPKGQYILAMPGVKARLVPNRNYVLLRRFSSKDEKSRLVAAPYLKSEFDHSPELGIENHLNYIYHRKRELSIAEAMGFATILNSSIFDRYFRIFNGNINVSATELRDFPLPSLDLIVELGQMALACLKKHQAINPDALVKSVFNVNLVFSNT